MPQKTSSLTDSLKSPSAVFGILVLIGFIVFGLSLKAGLADISVLTNAQGITVAGTAERFVTSDRGSIALNLNVTSENMSEAEAMAKLTAARDALTTYATGLGITAEDTQVQPFSSYQQCTQRDKDSWDTCIGVEYMEYNQVITLASNDVNVIKDLSLNINNKVSQALPTQFASVGLSVANTQYFYTKLNNLKVELLNEATKNAFDRAEAIANSTNNSAGAVITASQGVFQITSRDSVDTSDYGYYDTSAIDKKVNAVVRASFKVK